MNIKIYLTSLVSFLFLDFIWLGFIAKSFYAKHIGFLLKTDINWFAAVIFYLIFILGLMLFVIQPAMQKNSYMFALLYGALFGLVTYATYDLTNLATLKNWSVLVTVVDLVWGAFVSAATAVFVMYVLNKI